jgi:hypothetical protein
MAVSCDPGLRPTFVSPHPEEARKFLHRAEGFYIEGKRRDPWSFSVYALELPTGWAEDVMEGPDGVHLLLRDARILAKVT